MNETAKEIGLIAAVSFGICLAYDLGKKGIVWAAEKIKESKEEDKAGRSEEENEEILKTVQEIGILGKRWQDTLASELTLEKIDIIEKDFEDFVSKLTTKHYISVRDDIKAFRDAIRTTKTVWHIYTKGMTEPNNP